MTEVRTYQTGKHLEAFLLLLIGQKPDHGGALMDRLTDLIPPAWTVDPGRVYRILRGMEQEGLVTSQWIAEESGAPVRLYELTAEGHRRLREWKEDILIRRQSFDAFLTLYETVMPETP